MRAIVVSILLAIIYAYPVSAAQLQGRTFDRFITIWLENQVGLLSAAILTDSDLKGLFKSQPERRHYRPRKTGRPPHPVLWPHPSIAAQLCSLCWRGLLWP